MMPVPSDQTQTALSRLLLCTSDAALRQRLCDDVLGELFAVQAIVSVEQAAEFLRNGAFEICLVDGKQDARTVWKHTQAQGLCTQVIGLVRESPDAPEPEPGFDVLETGWNTLQLRHAVRSAVARSQLLSENRRLKRQLCQHAMRQMVGQSPPMQQLRQRIQQAALQHLPVLISGEPGTETDLVAQAIHNSSTRAHRPFIKLSCSVLTAASLNWELFGTGEHPQDAADGSAASRLALAERGALFLEDVDAIPLNVQSSLVGVLSGRLFNTQEASDARGPSVRLIAATHADLPQLVDTGLFRKDLHSHLKWFSISMPPLRERPEDIGLLTEHFLQQWAIREGRPVKRITLETLELLKGYDWPGNVQELQNVLERACAIDTGTKLAVDMVRPWLVGPAREPETTYQGLALKDMERKLIESTFVRFEGNRERTAHALKIGLRTLSGKLREYGYPPRGGPGSNRVRIPKKAA